jgi:hypothetical protein
MIGLAIISGAPVNSGVSVLSTRFSKLKLQVHYSPFSIFRSISPRERLLRSRKSEQIIAA